MYIAKPGIKKDPVRRWAQPDRIFFGNGACAILAGVFLRDAPLPGFYAERVIPGDGFAGNHIFVTDGIVAFDHHGYSLRNRLLTYFTSGWASRYAEGWHCRLERVAFNLLDTRDLNANKMNGPDQYLYDPIARAKAYLDRVNHIEASARARAKHLVHVAI
ncbi:hypothetical protein [Rhizobium miluonense]|uniref:Uncharacterized protein n=1 Tax=Rhizobium miluonense TaxID=411945 RepID=A0ABU1SY14_9HYPH|nr:hypothetical protein [Rhizobium miluonense]MDR6903849.1 hypothetical protein [Rhizobium miluonense]